MIGKTRFSMLTGTFLMVFILSAMWTVPAFADDSTPPPVEIPTEVTPPVEADVVVEPVESPVVDEVSVLDQLPEGTEVNVVGENGEALPLATQEAAEAIIEGDPIWCPVGVTPKTNSGGCTQAFTSMAALITELNTAGGNVTNPAKAGVIWIEGNYDSGVNDGGETSFVLDGDILTNMRNYALTIKGGWSGAVNTVIDQTNPSTFNGASLSIINWRADVTISDIEIVDAVSNTNTGTENTFALEVETTKNIKLDRVTVHGSINAGGDSMTGAKLNNASSTTASTVTVSNGIFEDNEGDGLLVQSAGIVTITSLFADGNDASGAVIDNTFNTSLAPDKAVTLKGSLEFNNNGNSGLTVISKGLITVSNVIATENGEDGVNLNNTASLTNLGVTVNGTNSFVANSIGLNILSHGAIKANNINASKNGGTGAVLDNCHKTEAPDPAGFCRTLIAKTVTLTGYNYFNDNNNGGLSILSFGAITVNNLNASGNTTTGGNYGVTLDNQRTNFPTLTPQADSIGTILLTGYGIFNNNDAGGLLVLSHGNVTLTNLTANDNGVGGVYVNAQKNTIGSKLYVASVTITGVNYFAGNSGDGLYIEADGKIAVSNVNASRNTDDGAELRNLNATDLGYGIVLSGTNNFVDNNDMGLVVDAKGNITVSNVTSLYNKIGASLNNQFNNLKRYNITLSGTNSFNFNDSDGLFVDSYGVITTTNLTANGNGVIDSSGNGVTLDNCNSSGPGICIAITPVAVTLNGYVNTSNNFYRGLQIDSLGAITLSNAIANGNGNVGVRIDNKTNPLTNKAIVRGVTLKGINIFNGNYSTGLFIKSYGAITLNSINASYNGDNTSGSGSGAYLENNFDRTPLNPEAAIIAKNITLTGVNSFIGNYTFGLKFNSNGIVTLTRISANGNDWDALNGDTGAGVSGSAKSITLTCGHMYGNGAGLGAHDLAPGYDLQVGLLAAGAAPAVKGVLTIKGIYSSGNNELDARTLLAGSTLTPIVQACALP